jgi:hypothetical protein
MDEKADLAQRAVDDAVVLGLSWRYINLTSGS